MRQPPLGLVRSVSASVGRKVGWRLIVLTLFFFVFEIKVTWGAHARPQFRPLPCSPPADISKWHICMYVRLQIKVQEQQEIGANTLEEKN